MPVNQHALTEHMDQLLRPMALDVLLEILIIGYVLPVVRLSVIVWLALLIQLHHQVRLLLVYVAKMGIICTEELAI